jgi:hypothetical protein
MDGQNYHQYTVDPSRSPTDTLEIEFSVELREGQNAALHDLPVEAATAMVPIAAVARMVAGGGGGSGAAGGGGEGGGTIAVGAGPWAIGAAEPVLWWLLQERWNGYSSLLATT